MKKQAYRMTLLFDFYGELLTERQKEFYDLYYNEDLSLTEIGENHGVTRQGVRDVILRAEAYLNEIEEKTGIIHRFRAMQDTLGEMDAILARMEYGSDPVLFESIQQLKALTEALRQE